MRIFVSLDIGYLIHLAQHKRSFVDRASALGVREGRRNAVGEAKVFVFSFHTTNGKLLVKPNILEVKEYVPASEIGLDEPETFLRV